MTSVAGALIMGPPPLRRIASLRSSGTAALLDDAGVKAAGAWSAEAEAAKRTKSVAVRIARFGLKNATNSKRNGPFYKSILVPPLGTHSQDKTPDETRKVVNATFTRVGWPLSREKYGRRRRRDGGSAAREAGGAELEGG